MKYSKIIFPFLLAALLVTGCRPEDFKDIGEPREIPSSFAGAWKLSKVTQVDEDAKGKGFPAFVSELDLTNVFPYTQFALTLNINSNGSPTTFTSNAGSSPAIINFSSGNWTVDNWDAPTALVFKQGAATQTVTLGAFPTGGNTKLKFKIERRDPGNNNKLLISYTYEFTKQ
ncbi:MAG TPA: DUF5004 domain-containing protein [Chitinophagaceae bacterium]